MGANSELELLLTLITWASNDALPEWFWSNPADDADDADGDRRRPEADEGFDVDVGVGCTELCRCRQVMVLIRLCDKFGVTGFVSGLSEGLIRIGSGYDGTGLDLNLIAFSISLTWPISASC